MTRFLALLFLTSVSLTTVLAEDGRISLFDGTTLSGWTQKNGTATYRVEDGAIVGTTAEGSPNAFLCTDKDYGNFELTFEVKISSPALNSGVQLRSKTKEPSASEKQAGKPGRVYGPQCELENSGSNGAEAGYIYGEGTDRGWLTPKERLIPHKHFIDGDWNRVRVVAVGPRIQTWINDQPVEDLTDEAIYQTHPTGFIGLQVHGITKGTGPYRVAWRAIGLKPLP